MNVNEVYEGDCLDVMRTFPGNCIDTIITDPPYGLEFMGKNWDYGIPGAVYWREALRVAKPGATLMAFGGTRTYHRLTCAIEDAGWEIRDCIMWVYGSGYPKSLNIGKQLDKNAVVICPDCHGQGITPIEQELRIEHSDDIDKDLLNGIVGFVKYHTMEFEPCGNCGGTGKVKGAEREVVGEYQWPDGKPRKWDSHTTKRNGKYHDIKTDDGNNDRTITAPATPPCRPVGRLGYCA